jgi:hypothetical protein
MTTAAVATSSVRRVYRDILRHIQETTNDTKQLIDLRSNFRRPLANEESVEKLLEKAESKLAFARMTSVKRKPRGETGSWIYRDGKKFSAENGTLRDDKGRVISNWNGSNLDPCSVTYHKKNLSRAGFRNNLHAKGMF